MDQQRTAQAVADDVTASDCRGNAAVLIRRFYFSGRRLRLIASLFLGRFRRKPNMRWRKKLDTEFTNSNPCWQPLNDMGINAD